MDQRRYDVLSLSTSNTIRTSGIDDGWDRIFASFLLVISYCSKLLLVCAIFYFQSGVLHLHTVQGLITNPTQYFCNRDHLRLVFIPLVKKINPSRDGEFSRCFLWVLRDRQTLFLIHYRFLQVRDSDHISLKKLRKQTWYTILLPTAFHFLSIDTKLVQQRKFHHESYLRRFIGCDLRVGSSINRCLPIYWWSPNQRSFWSTAIEFDRRG